MRSPLSTRRRRTARSGSPFWSRIAPASRARLWSARSSSQPAVRVSADPVHLREPKPAEWLIRRERGSTRLLRLMAFLSLRLGRRFSRAALYVIAAYFFLFAPEARRESRRYLKLALGRSPSARDRFRQVLYFATCIPDRVYLINEEEGCSRS